MAAIPRPLGAVSRPFGSGAVDVLLVGEHRRGRDRAQEALHRGAVVGIGGEEADHQIPRRRDVKPLSHETALEHVAVAFEDRVPLPVVAERHFPEMFGEVGSVETVQEKGQRTGDSTDPLQNRVADHFLGCGFLPTRREQHAKARHVPQRAGHQPVGAGDLVRSQMQLQIMVGGDLRPDLARSIYRAL